MALGALDREGRERLCQYLLRPPLSDDRLTERADGRVELALKTPWRDGTIALILTPEQLVARLAALIPRPKKNLVRYHGVLAPNARDRASVVPTLDAAPAVADTPPPSPAARQARPRSGRYLLWAQLLKRVFAVDVLECPRCGDRLELVAMIIDGLSARRYLRGRVTPEAEAPEPEARPPPEGNARW